MRKPKTIHYIYKTTCDVTGRYYVGMHSTSNLEDGYMGSGKRLRRSIRKYGEDNHTKEVVAFYDSRELLVEAEKEAITPYMIGDRDCMNLMGGGTGGWCSEEHMVKCTIAAGKANKVRFEVDIEYKNWCLDIMAKGRAKLIDTGAYKKKGKGLGRVHSDETKQKMSKSSKGNGVGKSNSQYGTCWITRDGENKKIKKETLNEYLEIGWVRGRGIK